MKLIVLTILLGSAFYFQPAQAFVGSDGYIYSDEDIQRLLCISLGAREKVTSPLEPVLIHDDKVTLLTPISVQVGENPASRVKFTLQEVWKRSLRTQRFVLPIFLGSHWLAMIVATNKYGLVALDFLDSIEDSADVAAMKSIRKTIHEALGGTITKGFVREYFQRSLLTAETESKEDELDLEVFQRLSDLQSESSCS